MLCVEIDFGMDPRVKPKGDRFCMMSTLFRHPWT
jgi:hypothetical protein